MIIEAFQRPDGMWSFRRIAMLGVQQDARAYPSCEAAVEAANAQYPNETVSIVAFQSQEEDMTSNQPANKPKDNDPATTNPPPSAGGAKPMDGNPMPERDTEGGVFKPADDTPSVLPKRSGPTSQ